MHVEEDMTLSAIDLAAGVKTLRIGRPRFQHVISLGAL